MLGKLWVTLWEDSTVLIARYQTFQSLAKYRLSFNPTLSEESYVVTVLSSSEAPDLNTLSIDDEGSEISDSPSLVDQKMSIIDSMIADRYAQQQLKGNMHESHTGAKLLTSQDTPDFMLLPLELQGYCPWTIVEAKGFMKMQFSTRHLSICKYTSVL